MKTSIRIYIVITFLVVLWCVGIVGAPILKLVDLHGSSDTAYSFFSRICHQGDARSFHIEGEKFGVCIRCSAVYFGFLAGLLLMPLFGVLKRLHIPKPTLLIAVMVPMLVDVVLNDVGFHVSTTLTRVATGALFGGFMPWYIVPVFLEAWRQIVCQNEIHSQDYGVRTNVRKTQ
jgi:uncharacterized membrane protein